MTQRIALLWQRKEMQALLRAAVAQTLHMKALSTNVLAAMATCVSLYATQRRLTACTAMLLCRRCGICCHLTVAVL